MNLIVVSFQKIMINVVYKNINHEGPNRVSRFSLVFTGSVSVRPDF